jgi:hypothetical protein
MFLTSQAIVIITFVVSVSNSVASPPDYQLANLILMGIYVFLTLVVAVGAIGSVFITRASLAASAKQSQDALAASEKQSQAAINAVYKQIEASKRQAQETMNNQFKPVVVPLSQIVPLYDEGYPLKIWMTNKGAGVALNMFGIFYTNGSRSNKVYHFSRNYFLVPDGEESIDFLTEKDGIKIRPIDDFYGYPTYPGDMPRINDRGISNVSVLMITYEDIFSNKYFIVFRYYDMPVDINELRQMREIGQDFEPGWEKTDLKRVDQGLGELIETKTYSRLT